MMSPKSANKESRPLFPRELGLPTRMHLWVRGYIDARKQKVFMCGKHTISSSYCESLALKANHRILTEWQDCDGFLFQLMPQLETSMMKYSDSVATRKQVSQQKAIQLQEAQHPRPGDQAVSSELAAFRKQRRVNFVEQQFAFREETLRGFESKAGGELVELIANYQDAIDVTEANVRLIQMEYLAKISCYCRGASRVLELNLKHINARNLDIRPEKTNKSYFEGSLVRALEMKESILETTASNADAVS